MSDKSNNPFQFWQELKRRRVIRVIPVYAAASFVLLELVDIITEPFGLPDSTLKFVFVLLCVGFIIAVILSWVYDITPEGVQKTKPATQVRSEEKQVTPGGWKISTYISVLIIIAFVVFYIISSIKRSSDIITLEKSIAVLPFDNMSVDEEYSHMGDAITDEIILELQKIKEFDRVLSRTSTMQYKENRPTIPEIAEKLGVNYIIEGSIQRHKEDVSIRVQVIRAKNEDHIWANKYDDKWEDIFSIQDEIAFKVANELKTVLSPEEIEQIEKKPTENLEAYDLYLKGIEIGYYNFWSDYDINRVYSSLDYFKKSIELDNYFSLGHAGLGRAYWMIAHFAPNPTDDICEKSKKYIKRAIELDPYNGWAYAELGILQSNWDWDSTEARISFDKALKLIPNDMNGYIHYFFHEFRLGNDKKLEMLIKGMKGVYPMAMESSFNQSNLMFLHCKKKYFEITEITDLNWDGTIDSYIPLIILDAYINQNMFEKAYKVVKRIKESMNLTKMNLHFEPLLLAKTGEMDSALILIERFNEILPGYKFPNTYNAAIYAANGNKEQMYHFLEDALEKREFELHDIPFYSVFDQYEDEPRFKEIIRKMWIPL